MTKSKPMTVSEFADYALGIQKDKHEDFNRMLSFVEDTVMRRVCKIVCTDCDAIGEPIFKEDAWWHRHQSGREYPCRAESIRLEMSKDEPGK